MPRRTCIGCRESTAKCGLVRVVRTPEGRIEVDPGGKGKGRGAYVHEIRQCWEKALKGGTMGHALRTNPVHEDVEALRAFGRSLPDEGVEER